MAWNTSHTKKEIQRAMTVAIDATKTVTTMGVKGSASAISCVGRASILLQTYGWRPQRFHVTAIRGDANVRRFTVDERKVAGRRLAVSHTQHPQTLRSLPNLRAGIAMIGMKMVPTSGGKGGEAGTVLFGEEQFAAYHKWTGPLSPVGGPVFF
jgi:hypothetical protein